MARPKTWKADFDHISGIVGKLDLPEVFKLLGRLAKYPLPAECWSYSGSLGLDNQIDKNELLREAVMAFQQTNAAVILRPSTKNKQLQNCVGYSHGGNKEWRRKRVMKLAKIFEPGIRAKKVPDATQEVQALHIFLEAVVQTFLKTN